MSCGNSAKPLVFLWRTFRSNESRSKQGLKWANLWKLCLTFERLHFWAITCRASAASPLSGQKLSEERELLLGGYFTHEYSLEAAALFNPSIVPPPGSVRPSPLAGHRRQLIIPYGMSGYATTFATLSLDEILTAMK